MVCTGNLRTSDLPAWNRSEVRRVFRRHPDLAPEEDRPTGQFASNTTINDAGAPKIVVALATNPVIAPNTDGATVIQVALNPANPPVIVTLSNSVQPYEELTGGADFAIYQRGSGVELGQLKKIYPKVLAFASTYETEKEGL